MINNVRNIVLAVINKESRGYITPQEFNLFCRQAQLEIFEDYFYEYNRWLNKSNKRLSNSEYSDLPKNIREKIDRFATIQDMTYNITEKVFEPSDDLYRLESVNYNNVEVEEVLKKDINYLLQGDLNCPTLNYPIYVRLGENVRIYPEEIQDNITCYCLRRPKNPKWTYLSVSGNPIYNPSASDFQDLEIHPSDETKMVLKVLSYVGISIREMDVVQMMEGKDNKEFQKDNS